MRNTDSLFDDESYFFAELKRLKQMLDELASGRRLLILLDEILKGTNSIDKLNGSMKLLERLIAGEYPVVLATHDLKLTELENQYPRSVSNYCFEIEIVKDEMKFDYRLRRGVTQVMNASFLMKKMGITS
jgi:DNA mismatch repair ATPase MutS